MHAKRPISNTPLAALTLLNDPTFLEAARALAVKNATTIRVKLGKTALAVADVPRAEPGVRRTRGMERVLNESQTEFAANPPAAMELLKVGMYVAPKEIDPAELAAWTTVCRVMLNLHETITRN